MVRTKRTVGDTFGWNIIGSLLLFVQCSMYHMHDQCSHPRHITWPFRQHYLFNVQRITCMINVRMHPGNRDNLGNCQCMGKPVCACGLPVPVHFPKGYARVFETCMGGGYGYHQGTGTGWDSVTHTETHTPWYPCHTISLPCLNIWLLFNVSVLLWFVWLCNHVTRSSNTYWQ
jgi:hypothetical protein